MNTRLNDPYENRVQTLRGLAMLLIVLFHMIGDGQTGLRVTGDSFWPLLNDVFPDFRSPLFGFISGFVYAWRPASPGGYGYFAMKKARRLLKPLFAVSLMFFALQLWAPGVNIRPHLSDIWTLLFFPYRHLWFLQATILIFCTVLTLERMGALRTQGRALAVIAVGIVIALSNVVEWQFFSVHKAANLFPYFVTGLAANRFRTLFQRPQIRYGLIVPIALISFALYTYAIFSGVTSHGSRPEWVGQVVGFSGALFLVQFIPVTPALILVGKYSFTIYLYHVLFTAGSRVVFGALGLEHLGLLILLGTLAGIIGPICIELVLRRNDLARQWLLGQSGSEAPRRPSSGTRIGAAAPDTDLKTPG